ncbi:histidine phosphatase family protein [Microbacterium sp. zg.B48]|uniref:histidine phosphatase family protein n=1 Tax=unclassified Microbacterium TaxID=2609290 RepID=UPI00214B5805|nr:MULTISPECIES: histidine phosphatase family protein [unclassified Microbacterium]MCR2764404.1 histidine phosphatase family protein [Microbacterium sp. zg.B48]MCR2810993.1 histidine phosphatase family protein [Microbacterium sp. zg.B185]WIM19609.1 histidine phosphatase family protein [Microbacterium sp. zg-B185]
MAVTELWLVRHGESIANAAASRAEREGLEVVPIDIRDADVPLSRTGEDQAEALRAWIGEHRSALDAFWVSPYVRARETLAIALAGSPAGAVIAVDERLRDRELGILDLLTTRGVAMRHPEEAERRRRLGKFYHRPPGGESWADVALRLRSFLGDALLSPAQSALIVAHDAVVMLLLYLLLPLEERDLLEFAAAHTVLNASVTHLVRVESGWQLVEFSTVDHLTREGAAVTEHPGSPDVQPE